MYEYKLFTSLVAKFMHCNTYDKPGVEAGKKIFKSKLNKGEA